MTTVPDPGERFARALETAPAMEDTPWTPLGKPLHDCRVALVTTGGVHLKSQTPFDLSNDGYDWSYRAIPSSVAASEMMVTHNHYDHAHVDQDVNFMLPIDRFREMVAEGKVGSLGHRYFSFYGYICDPQSLMATTAKEVATHLKADGVDAVLLTPA
ncbi:MAG: hypothetical protein HY689_10190 [Chloroflexi bacterium]|nr:hypothetical protein [Chloroflexota bacterium]